jgi:hypothetical protein
METHRLLVRTNGEWRIVKSGLDYRAAMDAWQVLIDARERLIRNSKEAVFDTAAIRSDDDPDPRWANAKPTRRHLVRLPGESTKDRKTLGRWLIALRPEWYGKEGGWIYDGKNRAVVQGYSNLPGIFRTYWREDNDPFRYELIRPIPGNIEKGN